MQLMIDMLTVRFLASNNLGHMKFHIFENPSWRTVAVLKMNKSSFHHCSSLTYCNEILH